MLIDMIGKDKQKVNEAVKDLLLCECNIEKVNIISNIKKVCPEGKIIFKNKKKKKVIEFRN